jgi:hypothetical protein
MVMQRTSGQLLPTICAAAEQANSSATTWRPQKWLSMRSSSRANDGPSPANAPATA